MKTYYNASPDIDYAYNNAIKLNLLAGYKLFIEILEIQMKISIGSKFIDEPWGGNEFIKNLVSRLNQDGHEVLFDLSDKDIDIILLTNPLIDSKFKHFLIIKISIFIKSLKIKM